MSDLTISDNNSDLSWVIGKILIIGYHPPHRNDSRRGWMHMRSEYDLPDSAAPFVNRDTRKREQMREEVSLV